MANGNHSGQVAEDMVAAALRRHDCDFTRQPRLGRSIYGHEIRADFLVHNLAAYLAGLVIEVKYQDQSGSADRKFPYDVMNIRSGGYQHPVLFVAYGGGFCAGSLEWLRDEVRGDLIAVFSFEEFLLWLQRDVRVNVTSPRFDWTKRFSRV